MIISLVRLALVGCLSLGALGLSHGAPLPPRPSTYDREVTARAARLEHEAARHSATALIPLLGLMDLWDKVDDRAALADVVHKAAQRADLSPDVRAYARWLELDLLYHQGQVKDAARIPAALGVVHTCQVLGPFDNEGRKGHAADYAPEEEQRATPPETLYEGKSRALPPRWRDIPQEAVGRDGRVLLDAMLHPDNWTTAYLSCLVRNQQRTPLAVAVRVGSTGAVKVWVNRGKPVIDRDGYRALALDQEVGGAWLLPGWNRLLVKVSSAEAQWSILLRLTTPGGGPLDTAALAFSATPPAPGWAFPAAPPQRPPVPSSLERELRQAVDLVGAAPANQAARAQPPTAAMAAAAHARAQALLSLGLYLYHVVPGDPDAHEAATTLAQAAEAYDSVPPPRDDPGARLRAYRLLALGAADPNERRKALETGLALPDTDPTERARLLLDLGRVFEDGNRERQAEQAFRDAAQTDPSLYTGALHLLQLQANRGLPSEAERLLREGPVGQQRALRVLRTHALLLGRRGEHPAAQALYREILQASADDTDALRQLIDRARSTGDVAGALGWVDRLAAARPELPWLSRERAELLMAGGRDAEALAVLDRALAVLPGEPDLHQQRGKLLQRLGRGPDALLSYQRALELRPQNPELRAYLGHLDPQARSGDDLSRRFRVEVKELLAQSRRGPAPRRGGVPARVLLDQRATRVHDNGLSEVFTQRVVEILDERGAREAGDFDIRYTPETQSVQIKLARVYKPSGEVREVTTQSEQDVSEPWYGLYYDVRAQTVHFEGLAPGDVIDVEYVVADVGRRNLLSDYFGDLHFFQEELPRRCSRYTLVVPAGRSALYFNTPQSGGGVHVTRSEQVEGGERIYRFEARDVPRIESESGMPGFTDVVSFLHVSTYRSWEDVAAWYTGLVKEQLQAGPEVSRAARAAVAGIPPKDERARVRAIYDLVVKRTRYVGLEFGIHGYKPYKVAQIFARKFGDCKDKAALLKVMLHEVGIEASMVLARTRRNGDLPAEPASLAAFDHAIVYVPQFDLFLDGTAEFSGSDELPEQDQDIPVLIISDPRPPYLGRGHLARTPVLPSQNNTVTRHLQVALRQDGSARVRDALTVTGQAAPRWREHYQSAGEQRERYEKSWNELAPGAKVVKVELPGIGDLERPVTLTGEVDVPMWGRPLAGRGDEPKGAGVKGASQGVPGVPGVAAGEPAQGRDLVLRALGREPELLRNFARLSRRRYDLILGYPWHNSERVAVRLPQRAVVRRQPEAVHLASPFGRFDLTIEQAGGEVVVQADLLIERHRIASADYPAFRRFCAEVDRAVGQELVVSHE